MLECRNTHHMVEDGEEIGKKEEIYGLSHWNCSGKKEEMRYMTELLEIYIFYRNNHQKSVNSIYPMQNGERRRIWSLVCNATKCSKKIPNAASGKNVYVT